MSKNHLRILREFVRSTLGDGKRMAGSHPEETYDMNLLDDPAYKEPSVYVPDDIKNVIDKWAEDMGLKGRKKNQK